MTMAIPYGYDYDYDMNMNMDMTMTTTMTATMPMTMTMSVVVLYYYILVVWHGQESLRNTQGLLTFFLQHYILIFLYSHINWFTEFINQLLK